MHTTVVKRSRNTGWGAAQMRTIIDCSGIKWTIFEVKRPTDDTRWSYLPEEYGDGWLCFDSHISKRRLTPIPARWRELTDDALLHKLREAQPVLRRSAEADGASELAL
jgi:hypothetical protein